MGLDGKVEPDLVESHEILDDGQTWRIRLRGDVTWHDGRRFGVDDVRATLDEVFDPAVPCDLDLNLPMVREIRYPGDGTIEIRLRHAFPLLPVPLSEIAILPAAGGGGPGSARTSLDPPVGTGPYKFVRRREDRSIEVHAHRGFHLGSPSVPRIILLEIPDDERRARAVAEGGADVASVKPQYIGPVARRSNVRVVRMRSGAWRGMPLNLRRHHLQDRRVRHAIDLAIDREQVVINALRDGGRPAYQPVPPESWAFSERLDESYHDPRRAMELLDDAGWRVGEGGLRWKGRDPSVQVARRRTARWHREPSAVLVPDQAASTPLAPEPTVRLPLPSGFPTLGGGFGRGWRPWTGLMEPYSAGYDTEGSDTREGDEREPMDGPLTLRLIVWKDEAFRLRASQIVKIHLRRVGIQVELDLVDNATYNRLAEGMGEDYDGFIGGWGSLLDPGDNLYKKFHTDGSQNYAGYSNETVDRMLDECRAATDPVAAKDLYVRLMEFLRGEAVFLPLAYPDYLYGVRSRVRGLEPAVVDSWYEFTRNAWRWHLEQE